MISSSKVIVAHQCDDDNTRPALWRGGFCPFIARPGTPSRVAFRGLLWIRSSRRSSNKWCVSPWGVSTHDKILMHDRCNFRADGTSALKRIRKRLRKQRKLKSMGTVRLICPVERLSAYNAAGVRRLAVTSDRPPKSGCHTRCCGLIRRS